jgi:rod shape-determining protein MreC
VQGLFYRPAGAVSGFFGDLRELTIVYKENRELRRILALYARDRARLNTLEEDNARLKEQLAFTDRQKKLNDYIFHIAQVLSADPDPYNSTVRINLGSRDGIRKDMAVVSDKGLLGVVDAVSDFSSIVQLITSADIRSNATKGVSATVEGKVDKSFGIIESFDRQTGMLLMTGIYQEDPLQVGDTVVTSGKGFIFPRNLVIGTVVERYVGSLGITETAEIDPAADFEDLREVFVVEDPGLVEG